MPITFNQNIFSMATKTNVEIDLRDQILEKVEEIERNIRWLAKHTGIPYYSVYACLVKKQYNVTKETLNKYNKVLGTSFKIISPKK